MDSLHVECSKCLNKLIISLGSAATIVCQKCGGTEGKLSVDQSEWREGFIEFVCGKCDKDFVVQRLMRSYLQCPYCGCQVVMAKKEILFSKITKVEDPQERLFEGKTEDSCKTLISREKFGSKTRIKIVVSYYSGNPLVERAVKTWVVPEVVFALTDEGPIPPGSGICSQFFTNKNSKSEKLHPKKTKPFLIDLLKRMVEMFPNEEYYGFFNSDIVLPPGASVKHLLPSKGQDIVFHHRLDLIENDKGKEHVSTMVKGNQVCVGKDGFVGTKGTVETIIREVPDLIVGAPTWDDGLLLWCWKRFGVDNVELRYGDIWHVNHPIEWKLEERDSVFNQKQLTSVGIHNPLRFSISWNEVSKKALRTKRENKILGIVQPGRIGDIIIVLPIAKWYYDRGFKILWPICSGYLPLFDYVNYVEPIDIGVDLNHSYHQAIEVLKGKRVDGLLDLGIGFGRKEDDWINSGLHFNEWKYKEAEVPSEERFNLQIVRDYKKEEALWKYNRESYKLNGRSYSVIHDSGTKGPFKFSLDGVRIKPIGEHTVFDWIGVIENAHHLYCVDSCIVNLADQMGLCVGKRSVWFWQDIPDRDPKRKSLGFPKLCDDWKVL